MDTLRSADIAGTTSLGLYRLVHSLAGAAGTFGYRRLGEQAQELAIALSAMPLDWHAQPGIIAPLDDALDRLKALAAEGADNTFVATPTARQRTADPASLDKTLIYVLEDDPLQAQEIGNQLEHFGYSVSYFSTGSEIVHAQERHPADAFLLDINLPEGEFEGLRIAPRLQALGVAPAPSVFISAHSDWQARLAALRAGGRAYFTKPLDFAALLEQLDLLVKRKVQEPFRVLIVEDTVLLAEHYAAVLQGAGLSTTILHEPSQLLATIADFGPDLIIMDLHMPDCSGVEAAQVIGQHPTYRSLPIVYLSIESALQEQLKALKLGGDDFLQKPISDDHLVAAVNIRAERFRGLKKLMTCDKLTGLLNHTSLKLALERELALGQRRGGTLSIAMIDIDQFKSVNDRYGHPIGDRVIKSLAHLLTQRLRKSDTAGRYGGEEFAVILPDTPANIAHTLLDDLKEHFAKIIYATGNGEFTATFSAGIATSRAGTNVESIICAADAALYVAKHGGRNRIALETIPVSQTLSTALRN